MDGPTFDRLEAHARQFTPDLVRAYLAACAALASPAQLAAVGALLRRGDVEGAINYLLSVQAFNQAFAAWRQAYREAVVRSGEYFLRAMPKPPRAPVSVAVARFDALADPVSQLMRSYESSTLDPLRADLQATLRAAVADGLRQGINPRQVARNLGDVLGLAPNQEAAVQRFEAMLRARDIDALRRALRDRRFDRTIRKAFAKDAPGLTDEQITRMVSAYRQRFLRWQAETMARTTALNAQRLGQKLAMDQAVREGRVDPGELIIRWHTTMDGRERRTHAAMNLKTRRYGEPWIVPGVGAQDYPGQSEYNCRCREGYTLRVRRASEL